MTQRSSGFGDTITAEGKLAIAHRMIMQSAEGPSLALLRGKAKRSELAETLRKLRHAIKLIEEVVNA